MESTYCWVTAFAVVQQDKFFPEYTSIQRFFLSEKLNCLRSQSQIPLSIEFMSDYISSLLALLYVIFSHSKLARNFDI